MAETKKVKKGDTVKLYGTGDSFMKFNKVYTVHKEAAEKLIEKGAASKTELEGKKAKGKTEGVAGRGTSLPLGGKTGDDKK